MSQEPEQPTISKEEYDVLFNWYSEWVRVCRLLTAFSFGAIGFTMIVFDTKGEGNDVSQHIDLLKLSWAFLGTGGLLAGVSIMLAYSWLDSFSRAHMPSLVGKIVFSKPFGWILNIGVGGWTISIISAACTMIGLYLFISAAWVAL